MHPFSNPDESTFGLGGASSHAADVAAGFRWVVDPSGEGVTTSSHDADIHAGYDDSDAVVHDGTGLHR